MSLSEEKLRGKDLIREATKEMFIPIMSSTIVTIAVFLPLELVKGMIGEMFLSFCFNNCFCPTCFLTCGSYNCADASTFLI